MDLKDSLDLIAKLLVMEPGMKIEPERRWVRDRLKNNPKKLEKRRIGLKLSRNNQWVDFFKH